LLWGYCWSHPSQTGRLSSSCGVVTKADFLLKRLMDGVFQLWLHVALELNDTLKIAGSIASSIAGRDAPALFLALEINDTFKIAESMASSIAGRDAPALFLTTGAWSLAMHDKRNIVPALRKSVL